MNNIYFISGIDTDIGKSYATGHIAKLLIDSGKSVITQKLIQTGCAESMHDIEIHRKIMGIDLTEEDNRGLTMPQTFDYPCSPHLAAELEGRAVDLDAIDSATKELAQRYDTVLIEGAGGVMVPLTRQLLTIDYIAQRGYPVVLVSSGRLGSINHTLLTIEAIDKRGIALHALLYNTYPQNSDTTISNDTKEYLQELLHRRYPTAEFIPLPHYSI